MTSALKRFGALGMILLVLNEVRGLVMVCLAIGALLGAEGQAAPIAVDVACAATAGCHGPLPAIAPPDPIIAGRR